MLKRIVRAYGAAQDEEASNVESVAKLAGVSRPSVRSNNNFLRSIGVLDLDRPKLTPLGVKLAPGVALDDGPITRRSRRLSKTTPILNQLWSTLRAHGSMDTGAFSGQIILTVGLKPSSPSLTTIKALTDLFEESGLVEIRDDKVYLAGQVRATDNAAMQLTSAPASSGETMREDVNANHRQVSNASATMIEQLLSKFPRLDPTWPDEVKLKWFDAFDRLMKGRGL
jgi:hypothetical protein